jgi:hypothetical protein
MLLQWREEMESRFGLAFQILDRAYVHRIRKERGFSANPWAAHNRFLISHHLTRDEEYAADLRAWLGRGLVRPRSMLILDEAHHAAPAASGAYAITSQFTRRIEEIAPKFEHRLFLSATPHNGHSNSFSALMALLDPQRFCRGVPVRARGRNEVLIYRLKDDLRALSITFPRRVVEPVPIDAPVQGTPELELAGMLALYCDLREQRLAGAPPKARNASALLRSGLQHRLLSSAEAFHRTLARQHRAIQEQRQRHGEARRAALADLDEEALAAIGGGEDPDEEAAESPDQADAILPETEADRQAERATLATMGDPDHPGFAREMALLEKMIKLAERARHEPDQKLLALQRFIDRELLGQPPAPGGPAASSSSPSTRTRSNTSAGNWSASSRPPRGPRGGWPSSGGGLRRGSGRRSGRPSTPTRPSIPSGSCWPPTPPARGSTSRSTAPTSSTSTCPGTPPGWSSATAGSTGSSSPRWWSPAATSSTRTARRTASSRSSSRRPRRSTASWGASAPCSTTASSGPST